MEFELTNESHLFEVAAFLEKSNKTIAAIKQLDADLKTNEHLKAITIKDMSKFYITILEKFCLGLHRESDKYVNKVLKTHKQILDGKIPFDTDFTELYTDSILVKLPKSGVFGNPADNAVTFAALTLKPLNHNVKLLLHSFASTSGNNLWQIMQLEHEGFILLIQYLAIYIKIPISYFEQLFNNKLPE